MRELAELEQQLRDLSHSADALQAIRDFSESLKKTNVRQSLFNAPGALIVRPPITYDEGRKRGLIPDEDDVFGLLQGDVISTEAAYHMGARLTGMRFLVANSTCDLVPGRRRFTALLPLQPIRPGNTPEERDATKRLLGNCCDSHRQSACICRLCPTTRPTKSLVTPLNSTASRRHGSKMCWSPSGSPHSAWLDGEFSGRTCA